MAKRPVSMRHGAGLSGRRLLIGMVHLPALPGAAGSRMTMAAIVAQACDDARMLASAGFDALVVENYGDAPFFAERVPGETIAAMAVVASRVADAVKVPIGVNVLRNDAEAGLAVAAASGAAFIRVNVLSGVYATDQGVITGRAAEVARARARLCAGVRIAADVHVKHAVPISQPDIGRAAADTAYRGKANMLIVSGQATGMSVDMGDLRRVREEVPDRPIWVGSGVTHATANELLELADGLIVGTCLKRGGRTTAPLDMGSVKKFINSVKR